MMMMMMMEERSKDFMRKVDIIKMGIGMSAIIYLNRV